jgi:hypothetical protein
VFKFFTFESYVSKSLNFYWKNLLTTRKIKQFKSVQKRMERKFVIVRWMYKIMKKTITASGINTTSCRQILSPWLGDKVNYGLGLSWRPASLCSLPGCIRQPYAGVDFIPPGRDNEFGYGTTTLWHSRLYPPPPQSEIKSWAPLWAQDEGPRVKYICI